MAKPTTEGSMQTRDLPALSMRAAVRPGSVDAERRTAEVTWSTGAKVLRGGFFSEPYWEELSLDPMHVRMGRLNNGAPLLNSHDGSELEAVLGVVEAGSARLVGGEGIATVRFAKAEDDPEADKVFRKVADGIIQNISVGYRVHRLEKAVGGDAEIPVMVATDWEPFELSVVAMGADDGAGFRNAHSRAPNPCVIISNQKEKHMDSTSTVAAPPAASPEDATRASALATTAERERSAQIRQMVKRSKLDDAMAEKLVNDGATVDAARALVLDALVTRSDAAPPAGNTHPVITAGEDIGRNSARAGITNALLHRIDPSKTKLEDVGRRYAHRKLLRLAEDAVEAAGGNTRSMSPLDIAGVALGLRSAHTVSDFPLILADVSNKSLRAAYAEAPATFMPICRRTTFPDFKSVKRTQLGDAPQLLKVIEGGEFTRGTIGEGKEEYALASYGRVFAITRQALVNDDMDAFSRLPMLFGRSARDLESDLVWAEITANAAMADAVALFHATHGNLAGAGAVISVATIGAGRAAMRKQKGVNAKQFVNAQAKYLVVPAALETVADQFVSTALVASASSSVNPFAGRLQVIAEPRLDAVSLTAWFMAADPGQLDLIECGSLIGEDGPALESRIGFDVDGLEIKCRHDFAAKAIDYRGLYKNPGA